MGGHKKGYEGVDPDLSEKLLGDDGEVTPPQTQRKGGGFSWGSGKPASPPPTDRNRMFSGDKHEPVGKCPDSDHIDDDDFQYKKMDP
jgi:hypothetical protein